MRFVANTNLGFGNTLDQDQAPCDDESLDRVGKGMRLVGPGNIGRGHKQDGDAAVSRRRYQLMQGPVLEDKADEEHEDSQGPKDDDGGYLAIIAVADPEPAQEEHGEAIDWP